MENISPENVNVFFGALFALSELLALTPLKSNSVFQLAVNVVRSVFAAGQEKRI